MKKLLYPTLIVLFIISGCSRVKEGTKEALNKGGEVVGKAATEIADGVAEGVEKALQVEVNLSADLQSLGLSQGKYAIENADSGEDNRLVLYLIFDKDYQGELLAKAFDKDGLEMGRARIDVVGKAGEAKYFDFNFDKRTFIETKSVITIE